jgi:hypothetical protein
MGGVKPKATMLSRVQLDLLREIIFLDADAAASHAAALRRVDLPSLRLPLEGFLTDHLHHLRVLNGFLVREGGPAPRKNESPYPNRGGPHRRGGLRASGGPQLRTASPR